MPDRLTDERLRNLISRSPNLTYLNRVARELLELRQENERLRDEIEGFVNWWHDNAPDSQVEIAEAIAALRRSCHV